MDTLELYRWAVQDPETHAEVLRLIYQHLRHGKIPVVLREDFAGTSAESVAWVALNPARRAIAVDLDGPTIQWASHRAARILGDQSRSIHFIVSNALKVAPPQVEPADLISVLNFSMLYLRERETLDAYLAHAFTCLAPQGILVMNTFGGPDALRVGTTTHDVHPAPRLTGETSPPPPFGYHWEVRSFDARTARIDCRIHFDVPTPQGHTHHLRDSFRYDWRLWSIPELIAACSRAGFSSVQAWRHNYDPSKGAAGVFLGPVHPIAVDGLANWTAYIVAAK